MQANGSARSNEAENSWSSARTPTSRVTTPIPPLLALEGSAGNAAVVQMLRKVGHPWAQERHRHNAGRGHEQPLQRSTVPDILRSPGHPLDDDTRMEMEARLGADFSDVRLHTDTTAQASAAEVGARAYTSGNHIVIGDGGADKHARAHELTHVIQQRKGPISGTDNGSGLSVSDPSDRFEREAEANATRVMRGGVGGAGPSGCTEAGGASASVQRARDTSPPSGQDRTTVVQRTLHPSEHNKNVGLHRYVREEEEEGRRAAHGDQAQGGLYQHIGDNHFVQVQENGGKLQNMPGEHYYFASSGTMRTWNPRIEQDTTKKVTWAPRKSTGGAGGALGRASTDEFMIGWRPSTSENEGPAERLAAALQIPNDLRSESDHGWYLVPTLKESPLEIFIRTSSKEQADNWRSGDLDAMFGPGAVDEIWGRIEGHYQRGKASGIQEPASWLNPRSTRPVGTDFDNQSATKSIVGKENNDPSRIGKSYEWCHLIGDADGGTNKEANLVAGTEAANTEQLILEQAQRKYREFCANNRLTLEIQGQARLANMPTGANFPEMENYSHHEQFTAWIRYTIWIYRSGTKRDAPVIDHIFDANRQEISKNMVQVMTAQAYQVIDEKIISLDIKPPERKVPNLKTTADTVSDRADQ